MPKAIPQRASRRTPRLSLLGILGLIALWIGATPALGQSSDQPVNDDFDDAIELVGQDVSRPDDSNAGATKETGEDDHGGQPGGATVWYRWTPSISRPVTIDTFGSNFDTNLAVYTGSSVDGLELIKTNDDSGAPEGPFQSRLSFDASAGTTYRIVVDGYRSTDGTIAQGTVGLNLEQLPPPPDTAILSGPAGTVPESETTAGFEFSGAAESFSYECRLDPDEGGEWSGCSSPYTVSDLSKGEHALEVRAFNRGGPDPTPARREWIVGAPSPTPETMIQAAPNGTVDYDETAANISFTAAGRNRGFECRLDSNSDTGWSSCTSPTRITDLERGEHNFEVRAISPGGVADATPAQASWTISPPPVPDTTIDSGPASETYERSAELTFSAMGDADGFECRLNSVEATDWEACSSPYRAYELGFGAHSFEVRAFNSSGADASPAHYEWSVIAPPAPETRIDAGPSGTVSEDRVGFLFSGEGTVDGFECRLDSDSPEDWASCASPRSLSGLADGEHAFEVRAVNAGGPDPTPASRTWTVDTRPELADTVIDAGPGESTTESSAGFSFSAVGVADGFECRLDSGQESDWAHCESPLSIPALSLGDHLFEVRALNERGADETPATYAWTIEEKPEPTLPPDTTITKAPKNLLVTKASRFNVRIPFTSDDSAAAFECKLDTSRWVPCSSPRTWAIRTTAKAKQHSFSVRAINESGQADPTPATTRFKVQKKTKKRRRHHR